MVMKMSPVLRKADFDDAAALSTLSIKTFLETYSGLIAEKNMNEYMTETYSTENLQKELLDRSSTFFVAEGNEGFIGYCKFTKGVAPACVKTLNPGEFARVYVDKKFQGTGFGRLFFNIRYELAQDLGCTGIWLSVWEKNLAGQEFHKKMGFVAVGDRPFQVGSDKQRDIIMFREV